MAIEVRDTPRPLGKRDREHIWRNLIVELNLHFCSVNALVLSHKQLHFFLDL